jgi:hypothetical protein
MAAALALPFASPPAEAADSVPACTADDIGRWRRARTTSLGVTATDRSPILAPEVVASPGDSVDAACPTEVDFAGDQDGRASDGIHDWVFAAPCKVTVCGEPQSFEQNRGLFWLSGEYDLNTNIAIEGDFEERYLRRHLCFDPSSPTAGKEPLLALQEPRLCLPPTETLHAEITPAPRLRPLLRRAWTEDWPYGWVRWKQRLALTLPWPGKPEGNLRPRVCAYGPFVADTGHAARAEIHPMQLLWWKESEGPDGAAVRPGEDNSDRVGRLALFVMQDASARYTKPHHFVLSKAPPPGAAWRPWAEAPVDGVFTVPFWSNPANPPRFRLDPYEYLGTDGGAPASVSCGDEQRVTALARGARGAPGVGSEETVASVCKAVAAEPPSSVQVEVRVDCHCDPSELKGAICPGETRGYLGRLVVYAQTGRPRDWSEGSLAMRLLDQRPLAAAPPVAAGTLDRPAEAQEARRQEIVATLERPHEARGIVTWKPSPGTPWERVVPKGEEIATIQATIHRLFDEVDWPEDIRRPLPSLWRLRSVDLDADAVVEDLAEKHRRSKRVRAVFKEPGATLLLSGPGPSTREVSPLGEPVPLGEHSARLEFPKGSEGRAEGQALWRLEVPAEITVEYRDRQDRNQKKPALPPDHGKREPEGRWTLWSHGLGAQPRDDWTTGVRALCDRLIAAKVEQGTPVTPPDNDLKTIVHRATKDDVVSVPELKLMVRAVNDLCGGKYAPQSRPVQVQSE